MKRILVITLTAMVAACGGGGGGGDHGATTPTGPVTPANPGNPVSPSQTASVDMRSSEDSGGLYGGTVSHAFSPSQVTVARGGTVSWTNSSGFAHTVMFSPATGAPSDIPAFDAGTNSRTFQTAGSFSYHCSLHAGMTGTVVVQ